MSELVQILTLVIIISILFIWLVRYVLKQISKSKRRITTPACSQCRFSFLNDPKHNIRETAKQLLLLEDHMAQADRRCEDCIKKHLLTAEALLDEALTLDHQNEFRPLIESALHVIRRVECAFAKDFVKSANDTNLRQDIKSIRKNMITQSFNQITNEPE